MWERFQRVKMYREQGKKEGRSVLCQITILRHIIIDSNKQ